MNERNLNEGQWDDRKRWSLGVGQLRTTFWNRYINTYCNKFSAYVHHNTFVLVPNWTTRNVNYWHVRRIIASTTLHSSSRNTQTSFPSTFNHFPPFIPWFRDHTQTHQTIFGRTPLYEWSARHIYLYLTTHNTHKRQTSMPPVGFEPNPSKRAAADPRLKTRGHWGRYLPPPVLSKPVFVLKQLCLYLIS